MNNTVCAVALVTVLGAGAVTARAAGEWTSRSGDLQNNANAGMQDGLTPETVKNLKVTRVWQPENDAGEPDGASINATPVLTEGLLITGDWQGRIYVIDTLRQSANFQDDILLRINTNARGTADGRGTTGNAIVDKYTAAGHLGDELGNYNGMQSTPAIGKVTTPSGEELRAYVSLIARNKDLGGLYCLNLTKVIADRAVLNHHPGEGPHPVTGAPVSYLCDQPAGDPVWPRSLVTPGSSNTVVNASPKFSPDQPIDLDGDRVVEDGEVADVLYVPSAGLDCSDGRMWAIDAYSGLLLWDYDPIEGEGGTIWTTPALSRDRTKVFITTGDCVGQPKVGEGPEALIALDSGTGKVLWHHQRRLIDTADLDIGTGPVIVDVEGYGGCHVVVSSDKDGCVYGFDQENDLADIGEPGWDPFRPGQQRILWKRCFVPGTLNGGFNASNGAVWGRTFVQQATGYPGGHVGADDSNAFGIDACTGKVQWASSDVSNGRTDAAVASEMLFQIGSYRLTGDRVPYRFVREVHVVAVDPGLGRVPEVLATVELPSQPTLGGGGLAIVDGKLYVPMIGGVAEIAPTGDNTAPPKKQGLNIFAGPYPEPVAPGGDTSPPVVNPDDPYPLMLENPNPTAVAESIQGYLVTLQADTTETVEMLQQ